MKFLNKLMFLSVLACGIMAARTLTVNDQIMQWTPKMIGHLKTARAITDDTDLKYEADMLLLDWNAFKNNLSARKSNQKVFLGLSKKSEAFLKRVLRALNDQCKEKRSIERILDDVYVGQNKVRGKK